MITQRFASLPACRLPAIAGLLSIVSLPACLPACLPDHFSPPPPDPRQTGSSTLANILYRYGESRKLSFMLPLDDLRLGWPSKFPGNYIKAGFSTGTPHDGGDAEKPIFDVVAFHAVLNHQVMLSYVPDAKFISIVRDPVSQFTSAWYFFKNGNMKKKIATSEGTDTQTSLTLGAINAIFPPYRSSKTHSADGRPVVSKWLSTPSRRCCLSAWGTWELVVNIIVTIANCHLVIKIDRIGATASLRLLLDRSPTRINQSIHPSISQSPW